MDADPELQDSWICSGRKSFSHLVLVKSLTKASSLKVHIAKSVVHKAQLIGRKGVFFLDKLIQITLSEYKVTCRYGLAGFTIKKSGRIGSILPIKQSNYSTAK